MPPLYERFDPPAYLADFGRVPGLLNQWSEAMSSWFEMTLKAEEQTYRDHKVQPAVQYFDPVKSGPKGPTLPQAITWNAFPKELLRTYSRDQALQEADRLHPLLSYRPKWEVPDGTVISYNRLQYRPQNEYCEWHVFRDPLTSKIKKVAFVSEPPEYYFALFGGVCEKYTFKGDPKVVLDLYREHVSPDVELKDLISPYDLPDFDIHKGFYNPYNKWNTSRGIMHLCSPPNTLTAEIRLGGDASVVRKSADGRLLVEPDALISAAAYGGPDRNSDPTIGGTVNALARLGAMITLQNPVGLYMDHIDLAGWAAPDGGPVTDLVRIVRGQPGMIERLEVEVPPERGFSLSDVTIAGVPIRYGGQIAECITVKLTGVAVLTKETSVPIGPDARGIIDPADARSFLNRAVDLKNPLPLGTVEALVGQGEGAQAPTPPAAKTKATIPNTAAATVPVTKSLRRRIWPSV